jgi:hypothetical protein
MSKPVLEPINSPVQGEQWNRPLASTLVEGKKARAARPLPTASSRRDA